MSLSECAVGKLRIWNSDTGDFWGSDVVFVTTGGKIQ